MALDYTKIKKKLVPTPDGQDVTRLRTATVAAVNSDGTLNLTMSGGATVTNVPRLGSAWAAIGSVVQVLSYRGSLLVLGVVSPGPAGALIKTGATTTGPVGNNLTSFTTVVAFGVTFPGTPVVTLNLNSGAGPTAGWQGRAISISATGFTIFGFGPSTGTGGGFTGSWQWNATYAP